MKPGLQVGWAEQLQWEVSPVESIWLGRETGAGAVVFSTPAMIHLMEHAAREALRPYLDEGEESVGSWVAVEHLAATPLAAVVRAEARITAIDGRQIDFEVTAFDGRDQIGRGTHRRFVIGLDRFAQRLAEKAEQLSPAVAWPPTLTEDTGPLPQLKTMRIQQQQSVLTVTLNRPERLNAIDTVMTADWERLISWLAGHSPQLRVVIVTGEGRAFCAGDDVKEVATLSMDEARQLSLRQARMYLALERLPQVIIAAVNGPALGGGCVCAYSCDFRIASHSAQFGMPEITLGWPPGYGIAQLTALVGKARAMQLCLTGKPITAIQAQQYGLVHEVVPLGRLMPAAQELAAQLLEMPAAALRETKRLIHADEGLQPKLAYLADTAAYIRCLKTPEAQQRAARFGSNR